MSRIDEALKRARSVDPAARTSGKGDPTWIDAPPSVVTAADLDRYPAEDGATATAVAPSMSRPASAGTRVLPPRPAAEAGHSRAELLERLRHQGKKVVVSPEAETVLVEQFRKLATTLCQVQAERGVHVVMVASAMPGEGKTLTAANLALTLSEAYNQSVIIIDADLRRPMMHEVFQVPNVHGVMDGLAAGATGKLQPAAITPRLSLLPAGRPGHDPMAVLSSAGMETLLRAAAEEFMWVIVDTPPIALLSDARLLSKYVDASVLVIRAGETAFKSVEMAVENLGREHLIGVVLNQAEVPKMATSYYHYGTRAGR